MTPKKAKSQRKHAIKRALQRYDLDINQEKLVELVQSIQNGKAKFLEKQSLRVSIFEVEVNGKKTRVVYDKIRKTIVSFLPLGPEPDYR